MGKQRRHTVGREGTGNTIGGSGHTRHGDIGPLAQLSDTYQVVTQTRWMRPDAKSASSRQRRISGKIFAWKPLPKTRFSKLLKA